MADVNGDGHPDLLVTNECAKSSSCANGSIGVLLGNGDGTFKAAVTYGSGGFEAGSVAVADLNGDGHPDLLVANQNGGLGVLLGKGDGTFQAAQNIATLENILGLGQITLADFNGDGKLDAAVPSGGTLLLGNGDGTFQAPLYLGAGGSDIAYGDFNGDGKPDLAVGGVTILLNIVGSFQTATTTSLASSANPASFGQSVTFTATVTASGGGSPTGTVTFFDGTSEIGGGTLTGNQAAFTTSSLSLGSHSITASYSGDSNFQSSTSAAITEVIQQGAAITSATNTTFVVGAAGSFSVTTTGSPVPSITESGALPNGVSFVDNLNGTGKLSGTPAASGSFSITFTATNGVGSPAVQSFTLTVNKASTTVGLTSSPNPAVVNQPVLFTATVTGTGTPTGTVTFNAGATTLGSGTLSGGVATLSFVFTTAGPRSVTASYSGDANFVASTSPVLKQPVGKASTTTVLMSSANPSSFDQAVTFTASVSPTPSNGGTVTFQDGTVTIGTGTLSGGIARFTTSFLSVKVHSLNATYAGDANFAGSTSATLSQTVSKAATTTKLSSSANPSNAGQSVKFTATITGQFGGTPTGTVTFKDGKSTLGTGTMNGGVASLSTSSLSRGQHQITTTYGGDANFKTSTGSLTQTVH